MSLRFSVVVAACSNRGIGVNGSLPWKLSGDMSFFKRITSETKDPAKQNVVVMGRKTWDSIPMKFKPLPNRINVVISSTLSDAADNVYVARSFEDAVSLLTRAELSQKMEQVFIIGGSSIYKAAFESGLCQRIYLTEVLKDFQCDTFLPEYALNDYHCVKEPGIDDELQIDKASGVQYKFMVYDKKDITGKEHNSDDRSLPLYLSVAMDINRGIGLNGTLPWSLKKEFDYFKSLISHTESRGKQNAVIMGRKTWESSLGQNLPPVIYIVVSNNMSQPPDSVFKVVKSFDESLLVSKQLLTSGAVENIWVLGGQQIYQDAIDSGLCQKIYLTRIQASFECDVHFPTFEEKFDKISAETLEENGVQMILEVYQPLSKHTSSGITL